MMLRTVFVFLLLFPAVAEAQQPSSLSSLRTRWDDSFGEWEIYGPITDDPEAGPDDYPEEATGWLRQRWPMQGDWTQWDFEHNGVGGSFKQKWKDDPSQWELRTFTGEIVDLRIRWQGDPTEWVLRDSRHTLFLKSRYTSTFDEWISEDAALGRFYLYTLYEGDPRDWAIEDTLAPEVSQGMRLALVFLATYLTSPKE